MIGVQRRSLIDPSSDFDKLCFESWLKTGSLMQSAFDFRSEGKVKPNGIPYSAGGIRFAALRHYIRNYPETRAQVEESYKAHGYFPVAKNMDEATVNYAFQIFNRNSDTIEWLKKQGLYEMNLEHINVKLSRTHK